MELLQTHLLSHLFVILCHRTHSHGQLSLHWLNTFRSKWWGTADKVLTFMSSDRSTPVGRKEAVMEMSLKSLRQNVPSPADDVHLWPPLSECKLIALAGSCVQGPVDFYRRESCQKTPEFRVSWDSERGF